MGSNSSRESGKDTRHRRRITFKLVDGVLTPRSVPFGKKRSRKTRRRNVGDLMRTYMYMESTVKDSHARRHTSSALVHTVAETLPILCSPETRYERRITLEKPRRRNVRDLMRTFMYMERTVKDSLARSSEARYERRITFELVDGVLKPCSVPVETKGPRKPRHPALARAKSIMLQKIPTPPVRRESTPQPGVSVDERTMWNNAHNILKDICKLTHGAHPEVSQQGIKALKTLRLLDGHFVGKTVAMDSRVLNLYVEWMAAEIDLNNPRMEDLDVINDHYLFLAKWNVLDQSRMSVKNYEAVLREAHHEKTATFLVQNTKSAFEADEVSA